MTKKSFLVCNVCGFQCESNSGRAWQFFQVTAPLTTNTRQFIDLCSLECLYHWFLDYKPQMQETGTRTD